ncbi:PilN domain-containing protein [Ferdinandcohnia quinoae]|uniref:PilN domain-containing protein n=1 Tax=Fredinandcohnia quinoae TaxID=2918902 RepID=A0AAW5E0Z7_9BACI|nr:PilN domain-containing protein [Fredinandcohnia sp. SECRCQ15]MCH1626581.1 PilN domain-containing protein [Fredinandcohnia sp. SECRCQ15]
MLVEINLLARKEYKNRANYLIFMIMFLIGLSGTIFLYMQHEKAIITEQQLSSEISMLQKKRAKVEQRYATEQESSDVIKLEKVVKWANDYFIETVPLLNHLTALLPEQGYIQSFSYVDDGIISLIVQFDTNNQVAYYLASLTNSPYFKQTKINSVTTRKIDDVEVEEAPITETNASKVATNENEEKQGVNTKLEMDKVDYFSRYYATLEITIDKEYVKSIQREGK